MRIFMTGLALALLFGQATPAFALFGLFDSSTKVTARGDEIKIDVAALKAGDAKFYQFSQDGTTIKFFLARDKQDALHVALDACDVCWKEDKGYKLEDGVMVCVNCGMKFPLPRIGLKKGGCNPHPVTFTEDGDMVVLSAAELLSGSAYFPENAK